MDSTSTWWEIALPHNDTEYVALCYDFQAFNEPHEEYVNVLASRRRGQSVYDWPAWNETGTVNTGDNLKDNVSVPEIPLGAFVAWPHAVLAGRSTGFCMTTSKAKPTQVVAGAATTIRCTALPTTTMWLATSAASHLRGG